MKSNYGWKFLQYIDGKIVSNFDKSEWTIGVERKIEPPKELCKGFNCSTKVDDAYTFVKGNVLAKVKYSGKKIVSSDKITSEKMTIIKAWHFTVLAWAEYKKITVPALALYKKVTLQVLVEYDKVRATALAEYDKVRAQAWKKIIKTLEEAERWEK